MVVYQTAFRQVKGSCRVSVDLCASFCPPLLASLGVPVSSKGPQALSLLAASRPKLCTFPVALGWGSHIGGNPGVRLHAQAERPPGPGHSPLLLPFVHRGAGRGDAQSVTEAKMAACCSLETLPEAFPCPAPPFLLKADHSFNKPTWPQTSIRKKVGPKDLYLQGAHLSGAMKSLLV